MTEREAGGRGLLVMVSCEGAVVGAGGDKVPAEGGGGKVPAEGGVSS